MVDQPNDPETSGTESEEVELPVLKDEELGAVSGASAQTVFVGCTNHPNLPRCQDQTMFAEPCTNENFCW